MYELSDKSKYIVVSIVVLTLILISLVVYNNRKNVLEHLDVTTTEAVKNMASIFNQDTMVINKLQITDAVNVGSNATVAKTLTTNDIIVNNNSTVMKNQDVKQNLTVVGATTTKDLTVNGKLIVPKVPMTFYDTGSVTLNASNNSLYTALDYKTITGITFTWIRIGKMMFVSMPEMYGYPNSGTSTGPVASSAGMPLLLGLPLAAQAYPMIDMQPQMVFGEHNNRKVRELYAAIVCKNVNIRGVNQFGVYYSMILSSYSQYMGRTTDVELSKQWPSNPIRIYPHTLHWIIA